MKVEKTYYVSVETMIAVYAEDEKQATEVASEAYIERLQKKEVEFLVEED